MKDSVLKLLHQNNPVITLVYIVVLSILFQTSVNAEDTWNFGYTGTVQEWTVPEDGTYKITVAGASGGGARDTTVQADKQSANYMMTRWPEGTNIQNYQSRSKITIPARVNYMSGGHGALLTGTYNLTAGTKLYIVVGQQGTVMQADGSGGKATYNGGGAAGGIGAGSGGGATSIQTVSGTVSDQEVVSNALIIAGGGGAIWSQPVGSQTAVEHADPYNLNNSYHFVAADDASREYTQNVIQDLNWYFNPDGSGTGQSGRFIEAMFPGVKVEDTGAVRAQISGSDIGAHTLMTDAYTGGGGGGYYGGNDGATSSASGSMAGLSYFGPDKTKWDWQDTKDNVGQNVGGITQLAPIGNGYATIQKVDSDIQTLIINLGGYITKDGKNQLILTGTKGQTVSINGLVYSNGYNYLSYTVNTKTNSGKLWGSLSGSFAAGQTATYTFGWNDDEITLNVKASLLVDTTNSWDGDHGTYVKTTIHLLPDDRGKIFIVEAKKEGQSNYTPLYNDSFFGSSPSQWNYGYTGGVQQFTAPYTGLYSVQLWGAGGGNWYWNNDNNQIKGDSGGTGGFYIKLNKGQTIYLNIGGAGGRSVHVQNQHQGGWNGGGRGGPNTAWTDQCGASGAGATSVQLTNRGALQSYIQNQNEVIAVVGGGAGATSAELGWSGGPPGSITGQQPRGVEIKGGQNKEPHTDRWWVNGICWSKEISGSFGQGASVPSSNYKDLTVQDGVNERWGGAEPNPGGGGGWIGGWAYESEGPSSDANAGSGQAWLTADSIVTGSFDVGGALPNQTNGKATIQVVTAYVDSDTITANFYDEAAPNIPFNGVIERNSSGNTVITWDKPNDNGSKYNLRVRRFAEVNGAAVDTVYQDLYVETGVAKYRYIIDANSSTDVNYVKNNYSGSQALKGEVTSEKLDNISKNYDGQYIHVAAIDYAGNIGPSATWQIPAVAYVQYLVNSPANTPASDISGVMDKTAIYFGESGKVAENAFSIKHYQFKFWNTKADGTGKTFQAGDVVSYDYILQTGQNTLTLYAQWEPLYILTVDPNGGLWSGSQNKQTFEMAQKVTKVIEDAARIGYNFVGWLFNTEKVNKDITLLPEDSWYKSSIDRSKINKISFVTELPQGITILDQWDPTVEAQNDAVAAIDQQYNLYISTKGQDKINANEDSLYAFSYHEETDNSGFINASQLSGLELLDTSNTINMEYMFYNFGRNANQLTISGLNTFDTQKVTQMKSMFSYTGYQAGTISLGDLSSWNVSSVTDMKRMFNATGYSAKTFTLGDLSNWNTGKVTRTSEMFYSAGYSASQFNIGHLDNWNMQNARSMYSMFRETGYSTLNFDIGDLSNWNVSSATDMNSMFRDAGHQQTIFNIGNLDNWKTQNVTGMYAMFSGTGYSASQFNIGHLDKWDVSKVTDISSMFYDAGYSTKTFDIGDLSNWKLSSAETTASMFRNAGYNSSSLNLGNLDNWDVSKVKNFGDMFCGAGYQQAQFNIGKLDNWNTQNAQTIARMFYECAYSVKQFNVGDLSKWDTQNVEDTGGMFYKAGYNQDTFNLGDLSGWKTQKVTNMYRMFYEAGHNASDFYIGDISGWDTSNCTNDMGEMFGPNT